MRFSSWLSKQVRHFPRGTAAATCQKRRGPTPHIHLECLEDRNLPSTLFVVPGNVAADASNFHDLPSALNRALVDLTNFFNPQLDSIQIEPNSAPVDPNSPPAAGPIEVLVPALIIRGDPNYGPATLPQQAALKLDSGGILLSNLNLSSVTLNHTAGDTITHCLVNTILQTNGGAGAGGNHITFNTITGGVGLGGGINSEASGDQVVDNLFSGGNNDALAISNETNFLVQGNTITGPYSGGIALIAAQGAVIGNTIQMSGTNNFGILVQDNGAFGANVNITGNRIGTASGFGIQTLKMVAGTTLSMAIAGNDFVGDSGGINVTGNGTSSAGALGTIDAGAGALGSPGQNDFHSFTGSNGNFAIQSSNQGVTTSDPVVATTNIFSTANPSSVVNAGQGTTINVTHALTPQQAFVARLYADFLHRPADNPGLSYWVGQLSAMGQQGVATAIARSPEGLARLVDGMYVKILGRNADASGESHWVGQLQAGATEEQVMAGLVLAPEFDARAAQVANYAGPDLPDANFVRALYELFLGRAGSTSEITSWVEQLGSIGRAGAAAAILASSEYRTDMVISFYMALLHRSPLGFEIAHWVTSANDLLTIDTLIAGSNEFFAEG
jgi:hypothetical protein